MTSASTTTPRPGRLRGRHGRPGRGGRPPRGRGRRVLEALGWLLLVGGLGWLAWVAWQIWGTTWQAHREYRATVTRIEQGFALGPKAPAQSIPGLGILRVPRFGDDYAVPVLEGTDADTLAKGVGHEPDTALPGERGNLVLAGHVVTHGEPFRDLKGLRPGDVVRLETREGTYRYRIDTPGDALTVDFSAGWVLGAEPRNPDPGGAEPSGAPRLITLITCAELFHTDLRTVVFGHQVGFTPRATAAG